MEGVARYLQDAELRVVGSSTYDKIIAKRLIDRKLDWIQVSFHQLPKHFFSLVFQRPSMYM